MRVFIAAAAFMAASQAFALDPATFRLSSGAKLVELCSLPAEDPLYARAMEFCNGYLTGSFQYYDATVPAANRFVCAPDQLPTLGDVMKGYVAWAKVNPQYMSDRAVDALFRYLGETYPCKK